MRACQQYFAELPRRRVLHASAEVRHRHCHEQPFVALLLSGEYTEAGDEGRRTVKAGDVLVHHAFDAHLNRMSLAGADILSLPLRSNVALPICGRCRNPDRVATLADRDPAQAFAELLATFESSTGEHEDWPDLLARRLRRSARAFRLGEWADLMGLRPETLSRGFRKVYGISPEQYRARSRARAALAQIRSTRAPLSEVAASLGFSDHPHMTRAVIDLTGLPPSYWRASASRESW